MRTSDCLKAATLVLLVSVDSVDAQSAYVGAGVVGDVVRRTHSESGGSTDASASGESVGFALRVGAPLGRRWGVDLELVRPGEIETDVSRGPIPLVRVLPASAGNAAALSLLAPDIALPVYQVRTRQRYTTLAASVWAQQDVSSRVALVYLAGMAFYRTTHESEFTWDGPRFGIGFPIVFPPFDTKTVTYGVRPLAGFEARIELTDHVELVPGLRLHGLEGAWLLRPALGLAWMF
jgi:opacity protein-like surface antigen